MQVDVDEYVEVNDDDADADVGNDDDDDALVTDVGVAGKVSGDALELAVIVVLLGALLKNNGGGVELSE